MKELDNINELKRHNESWQNFMKWSDEKKSP